MSAVAEDRGMNSAQRPPHHRIEACSSALRRRLGNVQRTDALGPRIRQAAYDLHQRAYRLRGHMAQRIGARRRVRRRTWASITVQRLSLNAVVAPNRPRKVSDACRFGKSEISLAPSGKSVIKEMPSLKSQRRASTWNRPDSTRTLSKSQGATETSRKTMELGLALFFTCAH